MPACRRSRTCSMALARFCSCATSGRTCRCSTTPAAATPTTGSTSSWPSSTGPRTSSSRRTTSTPSSIASARRSRQRFGSYRAALERVQAQGNLAPLREVRGAYADFRRGERAEEAGDDNASRRPHERREGRPTGRPGARSRATARAPREASSTRPTCHASTPLAETYVADGAALEVLRLSELAPRLPRIPGGARNARRARLRRADQPRHAPVQAEAQRPAPLPAPVPLHPGRRVPGRQHRPDRAHRAARAHAGPTGQRHGRRRRRPVDLPLPRRQLRGLRRVRPALLRTARP